MTTYACLNVYNEEALLPDCIRSVRSSLPGAKIILIDGAYQSWISQVKVQAAFELSNRRHEIGQSLLRFITPHSNDRTLEIAQELGVEHIVQCPRNETGQTLQTQSGTYAPGEVMPWESEWRKRARFFDFGELGDWFFIIDADERLRGAPEPFEHDHYSVLLKRDDDIAPYVVHRVFKKVPGLRMWGAHMAVWHDKVLLRKENAPILRGVILDHVWNKRAEMDRIRHMAKGAYYRGGLLPEENEFRMINNI